MKLIGISSDIFTQMLLKYLSKFKNFDPILNVSSTAEHLETIEINGKILFKSKYINAYGSRGDSFAIVGDLWFLPEEQSKHYPDVKGRLLEFCKSEELENNLGFDDWAEIPIKTIEHLVDYSSRKIAMDC